MVRMFKYTFPFEHRPAIEIVFALTAMRSGALRQVLEVTWEFLSLVISTD